MTFTEAAIEVLRQVEKPLPFQKISEMAVHQGLLSHVGKTPEATMSQRLAAAVEVPKSPLVRVKPGVYGLREWEEGARVPSIKSQRDKEESEKRAKEAEEAARVRAEREAQREQERREREAREAASRAEREARAAAEQAEREERERREPPDASEGRIRDAEDAVREDDGSPESPFTAPSGGRRTGRIDRTDRTDRPEGIDTVGSIGPTGSGATPGDGTEEPPTAGDWGDEADAPSGDAAADGAPAGESEGGGEGFFDEMATVREEGADESSGGADGTDRPSEDDAGGRHGRRRGGRGRRRGRGKGSDAVASVEREADRGGRPSSPGAPRAVPLREERRTHGVLVEALVQSLRGQERSGGQPVAHIVEQARRRNLLPKDLAEPASSVLAAAVRENAERLRTGRRPRFRVSRDRIGLWDWGLGVEPLRFEDQVEGTARRQRDSTRLALLERLRAMPLVAVGELVTTWLVRSGRTPFRHPSSGDDGVRFLATEMRGASTVRLAIEGVRGPVDPDRVEALARALGEVDASEGIFIATGDLTPETQRRLGGGTALRHVHLYDGPSFVRALEEVGVGMQRFAVPLLYLDVELLDALGAA